MTLQPRRAYVALVTCFHDDESLNIPATRAQVRRQAAAGNDILCIGTNGDFTALEFDEKLALARAVAEEAAGRVRVMVNVGTPSTWETLKLARAVDRIEGVDALSVITPYFIDCTQDALERHFRTVADAVQTPVYLYNIPSRTQITIAPQTALALAGHGNIRGIKDSGATKESLEGFFGVAGQDPSFEVWSGPDHLVAWALEHGAAGAISGLGNLAPEVLASIIAAFNTGDAAAARAGQARFAALRADLSALGYFPAMVKRALNVLDPTVGASRQPALLPDPALDSRLTALLAQHGLGERV